MVAGMLYAGQAVAQEAKPSIEAAPVPTEAAAPAILAPEAETTADTPAWQGPKLNYSLNLGTSFSSGYGSANYIEPSVRYQVSNRFRVNVGLTYMHTSAYDVPVRTAEGTTVMYRNKAASHYIASVGVDYLASDRLILSGNIWRDFSNIPEGNLRDGFYNPGRMGADFRATYQVTKNFSITGGVRYTEGASPFANPFYSPGFGSRNPANLWY